MYCQPDQSVQCQCKRCPTYGSKANLYSLKVKYILFLSSSHSDFCWKKVKVDNFLFSVSPLSTHSSRPSQSRLSLTVRMLFLALLSLPVFILPSQTISSSPELLSSLAVLDESLRAAFSLLAEQVRSARLNIARKKASDNRLSVSYGLGVALGTLMTIDVRIDILNNLVLSYAGRIVRQGPRVRHRPGLVCACWHCSLRVTGSESLP